ncbi:MAG: hypothetical protein MZV63_19625 [Marinilabiliales bacterium]|nr:hypothetical protein [Marinilabiliales bacterium]
MTLPVGARPTARPGARAPRWRPLPGRGAGRVARRADGCGDRPTTVSRVTQAFVAHLSRQAGAGGRKQARSTSCQLASFFSIR